MLSMLTSGIETLFTGFARFFFRRPLIGLLVLVALAFLGVSQARNVTRDGSIEGFFRPDSVAIADYSDFRRQFGQDGQIVIGVTSENLFSDHMLRRLADLHLALSQEVPFLEDITSLYNTRSVEGGEELFVVNDLLANFMMRGDSSPAAVQALRDKVMAHPVYRDLVISPDGRTTLITLRPQRFSPRVSEALASGHQDLFNQFDPNVAGDVADSTADAQFLGQPEMIRMSAKVAEVAARFQQPDFVINVAGSPVASSEIVRILSSDMPKFTLFCLIGILLVAGLFTRRLSTPVALLATVAVSAMLTIGLMAATGTAIKPPTQILPSIIVVAAACSVMHLIAALTNARAGVGPATELMSERACKERALQYAMRHAALPIVFTSLTTAAGLLSFAGSQLAPVADLGVFGAAAVLIVLIVAMIAVPVAFRLFRFRPRGDRPNQSVLTAQARRLARASAANWRTTLQITALVAVIGALGLQGLRFHHNSLEWLPADNKVRMDTEAIDATMRGAINLEAVIDTGRPRGVQDEAFLKALDRAAADIPALAQAEGVTVGKVFGVTDLLKEVNQGLMYSAGGDAYRLPEGEMIARQFLLFENSASNDLPDFVDSAYSQTRLTIRVPWLEAGAYAGFIDRLRDQMTETLAPVGAEKLTLTGNMALLAQTSVNVIGSMAESYAISLVAISVLMILIMGGLRLGLATMLPNLLPVVFALGVMGFAGVPLDSFTMLIGCITLGIIVDDTIHLFHQLRVAEGKGLGVEEAIDYAIGHSFTPILATSVAVMLGFSAYAMSSMSNVMAFGLVTALAALLGLISDVIVSPAIYAALSRRRQGRANTATASDLDPQTPAATYAPGQ